MPVQSVLFPKSKWTVKAAKTWLSDHRYSSKMGVHTTERYHRFRQSNPVKGERYRTLHIKSGIAFVVSTSRRGGLGRKIK